MSEILGYRQLPAETIELINGIKQNANDLGVLFDVLGENSTVDKRWLAIAKTDLQKAFMVLVRAVARPDGF